MLSFRHKRSDKLNDADRAHLIAALQSAASSRGVVRRVDNHVPASKFMNSHLQVLWLLVLSIPIASISWTVTHEEIFREAREYCETRSRECKRLVNRKLFYVLTCEYCLSHWITLVFVVLTGYRLLLNDWRGALIAVFALVWVANVYMSIYGRLRLGIKAERKEIEIKEEVLERSKEGG
jgi:hypothetical protein